MEMENFDPTVSEFNPQIVNWEIEHEDVFHLKNLYKYIHQWFTSNGYVGIDGDDKFEYLYFQKVLGNGNLEHHIWWRMQKIPDNNPYIKFFVRFDYQTLNMGETKRDNRGKQFKTNEGDLIVRCTGWMMLDYDRAWRDHKYLKLLHRYFKKKFYKKQIEHYEVVLHTELYQLQSMIKQYMNLKNPHKLTESFHPDLGL